jgi:hypothetical protein
MSKFSLFTTLVLLNLLPTLLISAEVSDGNFSALSISALSILDQCVRRNAFCTTDSDCCSDLMCPKSVRIGGHNRCTAIATCGAFPCGTRQVSVCQYLDNTSVFQDTCISPTTADTLLIHGFGRSHCGPCSQEELLIMNAQSIEDFLEASEQSMIPSESNSMTPSMAPTTAPSVSGAPSVSPYPTTEWATKDCLVAGDVCTNSVNCCNGGKCYGRMGVRTCTLGPDGETGLGLEIDISGGD